MFFYGSLMDPEVLQAILNLPNIPNTNSLTISGFQIRDVGHLSRLDPR
jgi:hypothetical protein